MKTPPIIITKVLVPKKRADLLHRGRLVDFIHRHIDRKLILISASAGYGKTSLLIDYAHDTDLPVCWYTVGPSDGDLKTFLEYLLTSIRQQFPEFGEQTEAMLRNPEGLPEDLDALIAVLVNEIYRDIPEYFVIVLDDYHYVDDSPTINTFFDTLLTYLPENCHFLIATRTLPRLTLSRLVARQAVQGLGPDDLRFTGEEIQALLHRNYNLDLPDDQAEELAERSEGWIAGILLSTHTLWQGLFERMIRARREGRGSGEVFQYLAGEVFGQQPTAMQEFLLGSSVLSQMSPALCDTLLGLDNSRDLLEKIENKNLFLFRLPGRGEWFRYHQLFQEFLQAKLKQEEPERFIALHRKAAELFTERDEPVEVINHYLQAERFDEAAHAMADVAQEIFEAGRWETLTRWMDALPDEVLQARPRLLLTRAKVYLQVGQLKQAMQLFDQAERHFAARTEEKAKAETQVFKSIALRLQGEYDAASAMCQEAFSRLDDMGSRVAAQAHRNIGICRGLQGELAAGTDDLKRALEIYKELDETYYTAQVYHDLGTIHELMGDLDEASDCFHRALDLWRRIGNNGALGHTLNSIGVGLYYQGQYEEAEETLREALSKVEEAGYRRAKAYVLTSLGDVERARGRYRQALKHYKQARGIAERVQEFPLGLYVLDAMADAHRLLERYDQAKALIDEALASVASNGSRYELGLCKATLGALSCAQGDTSAALEHLTDARDVFAESGAKRDLARSHLLLAQTRFLEQDEPAALQELEMALNVTDDLGYDAFLVADGTDILGLLQSAKAEGVGNGRVERLLTQLGKEDDEVRAEVDSDDVEPETEAKLPRLEIFALGKAQVLKDSEPVTKTDWDAAVTKELFFYFLAHPDGLRKEQIMEAFWEDVEPGKANSSFHSTNYRLRRALYPDCVIYEDGWYLLNPDTDYWYDVEEFEALLQAAEEAESQEQKADLYQQAIELYRGDYLEEYYSDWCALRRDELQAAYLEALVALAEVHVAWEEYHEAIELYRRVLDVDSYREDVHRAIMRCYTAAGDRADAIKQYERCVKILDEEMNLEPMEETVALYKEISGDDVTSAGEELDQPEEEM